MKKTLSIAIAVLGIAFSSVTLAERGRDHGRDYYRDHHRDSYRDYRRDRHVVINNHHYYKRDHYKKHGKYYHKSPRHFKHHRADTRYYRHYRGPRYVVRHHDHDDIYKWVGGIYLLNEILHHNRH